jgi:hypothetical protein
MCQKFLHFCRIAQSLCTSQALPKFALLKLFHKSCTSIENPEVLALSRKALHFVQISALSSKPSFLENSPLKKTGTYLL